MACPEGFSLKIYLRNGLIFLIIPRLAGKPPNCLDCLENCRIKYLTFPELFKKFLPLLRIYALCLESFCVEHCSTGAFCRLEIFKLFCVSGTEEEYWNWNWAQCKERSDINVGQGDKLVG